MGKHTRRFLGRVEVLEGRLSLSGLGVKPPGPGSQGPSADLKMAPTAAIFGDITASPTRDTSLPGHDPH